MGDKETYAGIGKLYVGIAGKPLQEVGTVTKCDLLESGGTPTINKWNPDFDKMSFEATFEIANNPELEKLKEMLLKQSEEAMQKFYGQVESFCRIFVEDYLGMDYEYFPKEYAVEHDMAAVWNDKQDCFYGLRMDDKLYSVSGLLFQWRDNGDLVLADVDNPYWANEEIREKLKTLGYEK